METKLMVTQKEIHELAKSKGWWPRPFGESIALLHSELSEAFEEWRDARPFDLIYGMGKPEGIPIEMADFGIRLMDLAESEGNIITPYWPSLDAELAKERNFACEIASLHKKVTRLTKKSGDATYQWLWNWFVHVCFSYQIPLFRGINLKHEYNKTRDFRHGGKLA